MTRKTTRTEGQAHAPTRTGGMIRRPAETGSQIRPATFWILRTGESSANRPEASPSSGSSRRKDQEEQVQQIADQCQHGRSA